MRVNSQPRSLYILCCIELLERFSFFGIRSLLVLYLVKRLGFTEANAFTLFAAIMSLMYATTILGGIIADRILGNFRALILGLLSMGVGYGLLIWDSQQVFYVGVSFIILGSGLFKPNINTALSDLYNNQNNPLRDAGFTIFYTAINIGAISAPLLCGYFAITYGWHVGFILTFLSTIIGSFLAIYYYIQRKLKHHINSTVLSSQKLALTTSITLGASFLIYLLLNNLDHLKYLMTVIAGCALILLCKIVIDANGKERKSLIVLSILILFSVFFFALHEQSATSITLFFERHAHRELLGHNLATSQLQSFGPALVVILGPALAWLWCYLSIKGKEPATVIKFSVSFFSTSFCFSLLVFAISYYLKSHAPVPMMFIISFFTFYTVAELCLAPIGLAITTKLAPKRYASTTVSLWFLAISFGHYVSGHIAQLAAIPNKASLSLEIDLYYKAFLYIAAFSLGLGVFLLSLAPALKKLTRAGLNKEKNYQLGI